MEPKIKNATFATQCNPYQNMRYNSESEYIILMGDVFGFLIPFGSAPKLLHHPAVQLDSGVLTISIEWIALSFSVVFFDPTEAPDDLILARLIDKAFQALLKFIRALSCCINIGNPDALVGLAEFLIVLPYRFIFPEFIQNVFGKNERCRDDRKDTFADLWMDLSLRFQPYQSFDIRL